LPFGKQWATWFPPTACHPVSFAQPPLPIIQRMACGNEAFQSSG